MKSIDIEKYMHILINLKTLGNYLFAEFMDEFHFIQMKILHILYINWRGSFYGQLYNLVLCIVLMYNYKVWIMFNAQSLKR